MKYTEILLGINRQVLMSIIVNMEIFIFKYAELFLTQLIIYLLSIKIPTLHSKIMWASFLTLNVFFQTISPKK